MDIGLQTYDFKTGTVNYALLTKHNDVLIRHVKFAPEITASLAKQKDDEVVSELIQIYLKYYYLQN